MHRVAEHVLSAALKRATGRIALRPGPGGVRTPPLDGEGRVLALVGTDIALLVGAEVTRRAALTTVREAAEAVGVEAGFPWTKYPPGTPFRPDERLTVDPGAAETLAQWFALGDRALSLLAAEAGAADDAVPRVYPEHFDVAISVDRVNYGASPGDADHRRALPLRRAVRRAAGPGRLLERVVRRVRDQGRGGHAGGRAGLLPLRPGPAGPARRFLSCTAIPTIGASACPAHPSPTTPSCPTGTPAPW